MAYPARHGTDAVVMINNNVLYPVPQYGAIQRGVDSNNKKTAHKMCRRFFYIWGFEPRTVYPARHGTDAVVMITRGCLKLIYQH